MEGGTCWSLEGILQAEAKKKVRSRAKCVGGMRGWASVQRWETEAKGIVRPWRVQSEKEKRGLIHQNPSL